MERQVWVCTVEKENINGVKKIKMPTVQHLSIALLPRLQFVCIWQEENSFFLGLLFPVLILVDTYRDQILYITKTLFKYLMCKAVTIIQISIPGVFHSRDPKPYSIILPSTFYVMQVALRNAWDTNQTLLVFKSQ